MDIPTYMDMCDCTACKAPYSAGIAICPSSVDMSLCVMARGVAGIYASSSPPIISAVGLLVDGEYLHPDRMERGSAIFKRLQRLKNPANGTHLLYVSEFGP